MCGIAGFAGKFDETLLRDMGLSIADRGPDDSGTIFLPEHGVGLAHRRLAIIDVSPAGHQPMWDEAHQAAIVFNGEIYNYRELRRELTGNGASFRSESDTEVLLKLYLQHGREALSRLNGIFAFAIWDSRNQCLFVARDGLGVKPLYFAQTPDGLLFASELKALLHERGVDRRIDDEALDDYLAYLWCPAPRTLLKGVKKLRPGFAMLIRKGRIERDWRFYDLPYHNRIEDLSEKEAIEAVRTALDRAVERQMVSDVPVGAFLSGGLDSSAVVALARKHEGGGELNCFTIGFREGMPGTEGMTEDLPYARAVAQHLRVALHTVEIGPEMIDRLQDMIYHLDEPQADPAPLNVLLISHLAREHGIKVLLSGAGGDDIFTGYRRHYALQRERIWSWLPHAVRGVMARSARALSVSSPLSRRLRRAFEYADLDGDERLASYFRWMRPEWVARLRGEGRTTTAERCCRRLVDSLTDLPDDVPRLNRMLYLEGRHFLADHNLNYTDKMGMAAGVEIRVPLLDPDLVDVATRLPLRFKQRGSCGKWVFKRAMEPYLPRNVIYRPKTGFGGPLRYWMKNQLCPVLDDTLSPDTVRDRGLFDPEAVTTLLAADRAGSLDAVYTLFALVCIEFWCRTFLDSAPGSNVDDIARSPTRVSAH
jgi:asparagine synthase (glutamine-hydrolysing)